MATTRPGAGYRRALQACETCRRKKTRCPGEKPICSNCSRLRQHCRYPRPDPSLEQQSLGTDRRLEARLAQLEEKLDLILDKPPSASPKQGETPRTSGNRNEARSSASPTVERLSVTQIRLLPSVDVVDKAIDIYFRCCHRQPCWIFESRRDLTSSAAEELLLVVLAISSQYEQLDFGNARLQTSSACMDAARTQILLKLANSTVNLQTLQALCLLAFANLVSGDLQLATFHITLAGTLLQISGLDNHAAPERTFALEEQRRLFWSVRALDVLCGLQIKVPSLLDIRAPRHMLIDEVMNKADGQAPLLPHEIYNNQGSSAIGIWAHMVRSASLWGEVREYVSRCHQGRAVSPWHPNSGYVAIKSHLYDMEAAFPVAYRFDSAKFSERTSEEIEQSRDFWLPWMKIQVTYHALFAMLNHPFLYSARTSRPKPGPNGWWKDSVNTALLHSAWIARLIKMADDQGLVLSDPFFAYVSSVAITLYLYWARASNPRISGPAEDNLKICKSAIARLGTHWPICRTIEDDIEMLVSIASPSQQPPAAEFSTSVSTHTALMWKILDFSSAARTESGANNNNLFDISLRNNGFRTRQSSHDDEVEIEAPDVDEPVYDESDTCMHAAPPDWADIVKQQQQQQPQASSGLQVVSPLQHPHPHPAMPQDFDDPSNWAGWAAPPGAADAAAGGGDGVADGTSFYDPWTQFNDRTGPDPSWWNYGNL